MPSRLAEAEAALDEAQVLYSEAVNEATSARTHATDLRERLRSGRGPEVTADALARADQAAEHADLNMEGARVGLADLQDAVTAVRRDAVCDEIVSTLPRLGSAVTESLDALSEAVATFVGRVADFNAYASEATTRLGTAGAAGPRVSMPRHAAPIVDRVPVAPLHGDRLLVAELLPALRDLRAPAFFLSEAKTVADAAALVPTA